MLRELFKFVTYTFCLIRKSITYETYKSGGIQLASAYLR